MMKASHRIGCLRLDASKLGDFQKSLPPFAKGGQGGLKAETVLAEESKSPLTPLLQRGGLV